MVPEPPQAAPTPPGEGAAGKTPREKVRVRFRKDGDLRLVSHRDLMKCFERMFRRAALPVAATQGFNPKPRMVFPLSLALGVVGCEEAVEIELNAPLAPEAVHDALARQAPPGLTILSVRQIDLKTSGQPRRACYRAPLPPPHPADLPERIKSLLAGTECWVERTRPQPRRIDIRSYVRDVRLLADSLEIDLWVTPTGAARPEEILQALGLPSPLETGTILERTLLELHDETTTPGSGPPPAAEAGTEAEPADDAPRPTSLIPGPLTFDT